MLEAADLPHCALSRALQARLDARLAEDRARRAAQAGLPLEAVPAAEGLTVRVINNVVKKCEVRPKFLEAVARAPGAPAGSAIGGGSGGGSANGGAGGSGGSGGGAAAQQPSPPYPDAFPYRQRVVLLCQRLDGVDVALFCMYVQEYGSDCPPPNR